MKVARKRKLQLIIFLIIAVSALVATILMALSKNVNAFVTAQQVVNGEFAKASKVRLGGIVVAGSIAINRNADKQLVTEFLLKGDATNTIKVKYYGILPDLFRENDMALAIGSVDIEAGKYIVIAKSILAKHDENYQPKELKQLMKNNDKAY